MTKKIKVGDFYIGGGEPLFLISGPCVIEGRDITLRIAEKLKILSEKIKINLIFKASYLKDNRSSPTYYLGPGLEEGLKILEEVKRNFELPVLSDIHSPDQAERVKDVLDVIQIPAFLSQQISLLLHAARTGKVINVKKAQFIPPEDMEYAINKLRYGGCDDIILTERGTFFGYHRLIVDMRSFPILRKLGYPVVFDITHSVRIYGIPSKDKRGGEREFIRVLGRAGVAAGVDGVFIETHPEPENALSDAASIFPLNNLEDFLKELLDIHNAARKYV
uniref:3-deoxy-8-phosphooctulonate synthase n=1 Tax=candidate division WOR-3 bacterium TaxID=2052148 RepID=A0A7C4UCI3_UNCW3